MGTYIARRLLLMVPTMLGITLLVFLLVALSPGGIGASLGEASGEAGRGGRALSEAYFEDRYGLNDPVLVQYARWLARISPIKFGPRDQVAPDGDAIRPPREIPEPAVWTWFVDRLPVPPVDETGVEPGAAAGDYLHAVGEYADRRAAFVAADTRLRQALAAFARNAGLAGAITSAGNVRADVLTRHHPDRSRPDWIEVDRLGHAAIQAHTAAVAARARLLRVLEARPFPPSGVPLIPGILSLAPPDLGRNVHSQPVLALISTALPITLLLNLLAFPIIYAVAIPTGILASVRPWFDAISGVLFVALWSIPTVCAGTLAIGFLASRQHLGWFPVSGLHSADADQMAFLPATDPTGGFAPGWVLDSLWHIALPVVCLVYTGFAMLGKQTRAAMLDNLHADYVRTARAKGVPERDIILRHVFRNSLLPLITMFVQVFPAMLAGSVVIERIFSIPGMGTLLLTAIQERDRELILANTVMIAGVNLLALLLADVLYASADPRVRYE